MILQQTRVDQGLPYYLQFTARWPTVAHLAAASEHQVLKAWQGLGYYSRARNLLAAARQVMDRHGGRFPRSHAGLLGLKGVGDYTASAIASLCFSLPEAVVDGNVYRVLARCFGIVTPIDSTAGRKQFKALATELLDRKDPGDHNQAVMELGATVCTPRNPKCPECPLRTKCAAFAMGNTDALPVKLGKTTTRDRYFNYLHIPGEGGLYLCQRTGKDIWQGLFEPPLLESRGPLTRQGFAVALEKAFGKGWSIGKARKLPPHMLSHQVIHAVVWEVGPAPGFRPPAVWRHVAPHAMDEFAVPRLIDRWLEESTSTGPRLDRPT